MSKKIILRKSNHQKRNWKTEDWKRDFIIGYSLAALSIVLTIGGLIFFAEVTKEEPETIPVELINQGLISQEWLSTKTLIDEKGNVLIADIPEEYKTINNNVRLEVLGGKTWR